MREAVHIFRKISSPVQSVRERVRVTKRECFVIRVFHTKNTPACGRSDFSEHEQY